MILARDYFALCQSDSMKFLSSLSLFNIIVNYTFFFSVRSTSSSNSVVLQSEGNNEYGGQK